MEQRFTSTEDRLAIAIDNGRQLFVDDHLIASTDLHRRFHTPVTHPASPVLTPSTATESNAGVMPVAAPFSDGVWYDPADQLFKIWYLAGFDDGFGYAESRDGIEWYRPTLDVVPGTNRTLTPIPGFARDGATVWLDHRAGDPNERFKMFAFFIRGTGSWPRALADSTTEMMGNLYTSPDGVHWQLRGKTGRVGDNTSFFFNPFRDKWTFSVRTNNRESGRTRSYREQGAFVGEPWPDGDVVYWAAADDHDLPDPTLQYAPELYKIDCVAYESILIGLSGIMLGPPNAEAYAEKIPKTVNLHWGFSRGDLQLVRPNRQPFIACSEQPGSWNRGYIHAAGGVCLVVGDELWFYHGAWSGVSPAQGTGPYAGGSTGLAVLRRDGFASMQGPGESMGPRHDLRTHSLTTRPVTFSGSHLFVNAMVRRGEMRVGVLDSDGGPIPGFEPEASTKITTDSTRHAVSWNDRRDLSSLRGRPVRLQFHVDGGAALYSFWISADSSGASGGYVAAGGPGFTSDVDGAGK